MRPIDADTLIDAMTGACNIFDAHGIDTTISRTLITIARQAPTVSGWISVKDGLPDVAGYECLVVGVNCFGQKFVFTAFTGYGEPGWLTNDTTYMRREIDEADNRLSPVWEVTHWMPLPEPPKEET